MKLPLLENSHAINVSRLHSLAGTRKRTISTKFNYTINESREMSSIQLLSFKKGCVKPEINSKSECTNPGGRGLSTAFCPFPVFFRKSSTENSHDLKMHKFNYLWKFILILYITSWPSSEHDEFLFRISLLSWKANELEPFYISLDNWRWIVSVNSSSDSLTV